MTRSKDVVRKDMKTIVIAKNRDKWRQMIVNVLPVESVIVWWEALHHEILDHNQVIQNIFPCNF